MDGVEKKTTQKTTFVLQIIIIFKWSFKIYNINFLKFHSRTQATIQKKMTKKANASHK